MAKVEWSAWFDDVLPDLPGCGQALATLHIRAAAIDFCKRSMAWRVDMDAVNAKANIAEYDFEPDSGQVVVRAMLAWYDKKQLTPKSPGELECMYSHWPSQVGTPVYFTQENPSDSLILVPMPIADLTKAITAKLAVKPSQTSTAIDGSIFEEWREAIAHGALARLFALSKKPWTNATLAGYHIGEFDQKVASAALAASRGFTRAKQRTRAKFF